MNVRAAPERSGFRVAVVGATGLVGETMIRVLEEREFPVSELYALASARSVGRRVEFRGRSLPVRELADFDFGKADIGLFSPGAEVSRVYAPKAAAAGCVVIDNTSEFRYREEIPLVVPEVNAHAISQYRNRGIIANPNCSTIQMVVALKPIHDAVGIEHINVATYQSVSGAGREAVEELAAQSAALLSGKGPVEPNVIPKQIAFNCVPHIDAFQENGYTKEEMKMVNETRKIMGDSSIDVSPTCVRVPVPISHSESILVETERPISPGQAREIWANSPGVTVVDDALKGTYPLAAQAAGKDDVFVGRIRQDLGRPNTLLFWCVSDNLRKGAATNAVQIAEKLIELA
jgi:aspartate-semialdehyde dehydrogenase